MEGRIKRTRAEFWVRLQANEERVIYEREFSDNYVGAVLAGIAYDVLGSSITVSACVLPFHRVR